MTGLDRVERSFGGKVILKGQRRTMEKLSGRLHDLALEYLTLVKPRSFKAGNSARAVCKQSEMIREGRCWKGSRAEWKRISRL